MHNIINHNYFIPNQEYKVLVRCFTFNQRKFIDNALNGFVIQQTKFPFVCLVMDDASTDGEQETIHKWIESECDMRSAKIVDIPSSIVIIAPHKINTHCTFAFYLLKKNLYKVYEEKIRYVAPWRERCEYEAICEGDDYWIDPLKLQRQVDVLDANPKYVFCHTGFKILDNSKNEFIDCSEIIQRNTKTYYNNKNIMEDIVYGNQYRIQTMSVLIRLSEYSKAKSIIEPYDGKFLMGDTQIWLALLSLGDVCFMPEITSVYRVNLGSSCQQIDIKNRIRFDLSCAEMRIEMAKLFNLSKKLEKILQKQYQKKLNLYYCYDYEYKPFVDLRFANIFDRIRYNTLKIKVMRILLKWVYENVLLS